MSDKTLTRADLADAIYRLNVGNRQIDPPELISRDESAELVETVLQHVADALVAGEMVKISSFGAFEVREKAERIGRNPKTGQEATITPRRVLSFRASHVLKDRINGVEPSGENDDEDSEPARRSSPSAAASKGRA
ncbi:MAG: integration host factor subunit alpha [Rhodobacteraceae bacterium]|nr:integration host factor subunit alpha [Paracoccaceae bacterium]